MRGSFCWMRFYIVGKSLENIFFFSYFRYGNLGRVTYCILIDVMINSCICFSGELGIRFYVLYLW